MLVLCGPWGRDEVGDARMLRVLVDAVVDARQRAAGCPRAAVDAVDSVIAELLRLHDAETTGASAV